MSENPVVRSLAAWNSWYRVAGSIVAVALVTGAIELIEPYVPVLSLGVLYIFAVLPVAIAFGLTYGVAVAIGSMLAFNFFFLPPLYTLTIENIGTDARVKDAGGPLIDIATPKEGIYGWMDAEMLLKESSNSSSFEPFINAMEQAPWIAKNFLTNGRPLFNEKAYKILVNNGHKARADRFFYNQPERPISMTLKGPSGNVQAYIDAFNEAFAA